MQHLREASRCDGQAELGPEQVRDLRQRHTQVRVQPHDQRDDFGTELHAGRSQPRRRFAAGGGPGRDADHCEQWPTSMSKRRTMGRTTGRSS